MYVEAVVRFDAREMDTRFTELWSAERQAIFLLRTDVEKPLSTDDAVWESMFGRTKIEFLDWVHEKVYRTPRIELPKWTGTGQNTWESLEEMRAFIGEHQAELDGRHYWTVAITQCVSPEEVATWYPTPPEVQPEWSFLGYDVSDYFLLSGLMNCGYTVEDGDLKNQWADKLNRYHLFEKMEDALDYVPLTDKRVKGHEPFFAYGIYVIEKHE